jgi:hypothetical protein
MLSNKLKNFDRTFLERLWIVLPKNEMRVNFNKNNSKHILKFKLTVNRARRYNKNR